MKPEQYFGHLKKLGLNHSTGSEFLGISYRTSRRFGRGLYPVPRLVAMVLRMAVRYKLTPDAAVKKFGE